MFEPRTRASRGPVGLVLFILNIIIILRRGGGLRSYYQPRNWRQ